jgi:hypothetical protein
MTKNNFTALAAALKATKPTGDAGWLEQWNNDVIVVMNICTVMNPRFNKGKFIAACGVPNILDDGITAGMRKGGRQLSPKRRLNTTYACVDKR